MADISRLARLVNGVVRGLDLTQNTLVLENVKLNLGGANQVTFSGSLTSNRTITIPDANVDLGLIASAIQSSEKGAANGVATLDVAGKVPVAQLPNSVMEYQGAWDADQNTPELEDGTGNNGDVYRVSVAGSQDLGSGSISFSVGDFVIYNGSTWQKSPAIDAGSLTLDDLTDVVLSSPANGQVLTYNGTQWVNQNAPAGTTLQGLSGDLLLQPGFGLTISDNDNDTINIDIELDGTTLAKNITGLKVDTAGITDNELASSSVTEAKIASSAVTSDKIASDAVVEGKIANNAVTTDKINNSAVTEGKLASSAVTSSKIANNAVTSEKIDDAAVTSAKIANSAVDRESVQGGFGTQLFSTANLFQTYIDSNSNTISTPKAGEDIPSGLTALRIEWDSVNSELVCFLADNDASIDANYNVIGLHYRGFQIDTGNFIDTLVTSGIMTFPSSVFTDEDAGATIYLGTSGVPTLTPPTANDTAVVELGTVISSTVILVKPSILRGIN